MMQSEEPHTLNISTWLILLIAAINGLVYLFLVPPWQNNDEMGQFEYAWMIANFGYVPTRGEYDQSLRREIVSSMIEYKFFTNGQDQPNLISIDQPLWIGPEQVGGLSLYYYLLSLPLRLVRSLDVTLQLYLARLFSWILFIVTIIIIKIAAQEILKDNKLVNIVVGFSAFLPGFVTKMVAVNDDVGAILFMTLYIWFGCRFLTYGWSLINTIGLVLSLFLAFFTKQTTWISLPLIAWIILFGIFRQKREQRLVAIWFLLVIIAIPIIYIAWGRTTPAYYYPLGAGEFPSRVTSFRSIKGRSVLELNHSSLKLYQIVKFDNLEKEQFEVATIGFWAWSSQPTSIPSSFITLNNQLPLETAEIKLSQEPAFYQLTYPFPEEAKSTVFLDRILVGNEAKVYFDCMFLIPGEHSDDLPIVREEDCAVIEWGEYVGRSYIRNGSFEKGWIYPRQFVIPGPYSINHFQLFNGLMGLFDPVASSDYVRDFFRYLFMTFWGRFGWGTFGYMGDDGYIFFQLVTLFCILGILSRLINCKRIDKLNLPKSIVWFFTLLVFLQLCVLYLREAGNWYAGYLLLPQARYFFPVILPVSVLFGLGWYNYFIMLNQKWRKEYGQWIFLGVMGVVNLWGIYSIWRFYYQS